MRTVACALMKCALLGLIAIGASVPAWSQAPYPNRLVKLLVPFPAGGPADIVARAYAEKFAQRIGQVVIVENRHGATGAVGTSAVLNAPADGYTLLLHTSAMVVSPWVMKQPFDALTDLVPVVRTAETSYLVTVSPSLPVRNLDEFVAYAKKQPGRLSCATYGVASPAHLSLELLNREAGVDILHVPYKSYMQAMTDMLSGQLACSVDPPTVPIPHVRSGRIRAIAHTGSGSMHGFESLDSFGRSYPKAAVAGWQGIFVRAGTPAPILERLRAEWREVVASPEIVDKVRFSGFEPMVGDSIEAFSAAIHADHEKFGRIIKDSGVRLE